MLSFKFLRFGIAACVVAALFVIASQWVGASSIQVLNCPGTAAANTVLKTDGTNCVASAITESGGSVGVNAGTPGAALEVDTPAAATKGYIIKAAPSQTANLLEIQNSAGTVIGFVSQDALIWNFSGGINDGVTLKTINFSLRDLGGTTVLENGGGGGMNFNLPLNLSGSNFVFSTASELMRLTHDGKLGIGKLPANLLDVAGLTGSTAVISTGTTFTLSGCGADTPVGGAAAGTFVSHTAGTCTVVITINGAVGATAPNGWTCSATDLTTVTDILHQILPISTTQCTISGPTLAGDEIIWNIGLGF